MSWHHKIAFWLGLICVLGACTEKKEERHLLPPELGPYALRGLSPAEDSARENAPAPSQSTAPQDRTLKGVVKLSPNLSGKIKAGPKVLFVIAKGPEIGPPLAVQKLAVDTFPIPFSLSEKDAMVPGRALTGPIQLQARLDADGSAGPPSVGDIGGAAKKPAQLGDQHIEIILDQEY